MDIRQMLTYTDRCRERLRETLEAHPETFDRPFETRAEYRSVRALIAHCIGAEQRWTEQRLQGRPSSARYESCAAESLTALFHDWDVIRAKTREITEASHTAGHPTQLHHEIAFTLPQWKHTDVLTVEEVLFQIFNHQIYHLGQITMVLQQMGVDAPNFDYVLLHRDREQEE